MVKFLDDPFKKVAYSFRIEERLLNDVKKYAKATNRKLPETFNYLIRESLKGYNLDNTYLSDFEGLIINVTHIVKDPNSIRTDARRYGSDNFLNFEKEGVLYEVKKIPNNLDVWDTELGYFSKQKDLLHEGVSVLVAPEIVFNNVFNISQDYIMDCLKYIYFKMDLNGEVTVSNISYKECFRKLKEAGNDELLYKFKSIYATIEKFSNAFVEMIIKADDNRGKKDFINELYANLLNFANKYNGEYINSLDDMKPELNINDVVIDTNYETPEKDLNSIIEDLQNQINEKDKAIKEYEKLTTELENSYNDLDKRIQQLENKK